MADPGHEIPYTVGDQERQVRIEDTLNKLLKTTEDAAFAAKEAAEAAVLVAKEARENPFPRCAANMEKIASLEQSRKRGKYISGSIIIGLVLYIFKTVVEAFGG